MTVFVLSIPASHTIKLIFFIVKNLFLIVCSPWKLFSQKQAMLNEEDLFQGRLIIKSCKFWVFLTQSSVIVPFTYYITQGNMGYQT